MVNIHEQTSTAFWTLRRGYMELYGHWNWRHPQLKTRWSRWRKIELRAMTLNSNQAVESAASLFLCRFLPFPRRNHASESASEESFDFKFKGISIRRCDFVAMTSSPCHHLVPRKWKVRHAKFGTIRVSVYSPIRSHWHCLLVGLSHLICTVDLKALDRTLLLDVWLVEWRWL